MQSWALGALCRFAVPKSGDHASRQGHICKPLAGQVFECLDFGFGAKGGQLRLCPVAKATKARGHSNSFACQKSQARGFIVSKKGPVLKFLYLRGP